jgi:hypothetical protein
MYEVLGVILVGLAVACIVVSIKGGAALDEGHKRLLLQICGALVAAVALFFFYLGVGIGKIALELSASTLEIKGPLYGRAIPRAQLKVSEAEVVDLQGGYLPSRRQNGIGLSSLKFGWFKLGNGEKSLLVVGDHKRAVHVPTTEGYSLLLTPSDPEAFLTALR